MRSWSASRVAWVVAALAACGGASGVARVPQRLRAPHVVAAPAARAVERTAAMFAGSRTSLSARGVWHSCAVVDGIAMCWGANEHGQLGDGTRADRDAPVRAAGVADVVEVSTAASSSCARTTDGAVWCWGEHAAPGPYPTARDAPVRIARIDDAVEIGVGGGMTCARRATGGVSCWGFSHADGDAGPTPVPQIETAAQLAVGELRACVLTEEHEVWCWSTHSLTPERVDLPADAVRIAVSTGVGDPRVCAVRRGGTVRCEGRTCSRHPNTPDVPIAEEVEATLTDVTDVALGNGHGCALLRDGTLSCWSWITPSTPIRGCIARAPEPLRMPDARDVAEVSIGITHVCVRRRDGTVACRGSNERGQLGTRARPEDDETATGVPGVAGAVEVIASGHETCARHTDGSVRCWGPRFGGRAVTIAGFHGASQVALGARHACARMPGGSVVCLGENADGQLGDGTRRPSEAPVRVLGLRDAVAIALVRDRSCAVRRNGSVQCWGRAEGAPLADASAANAACAPPAQRPECSDVPVTQPELANVVGLALAGDQFFSGAAMCVLWRDGAARCLPETTSGSDRARAALRAPPVVRDAVELAATTYTACVRSRAGAVQCWTAVPERGGARAPARVDVDGAPVAQLSAGHLWCARRTDGAVACWQEPDAPHELAATLVDGLEGARSIASGALHACAALTANGVVRCWGHSAWGQRGDGAVRFRETLDDVRVDGDRAP